MKRSRDIRVIRTQTSLLEALRELLSSKKLSGITITDLCSEAKVNRNTFYYHYNNIIEFLDDHKKLVIDELNQIPEVSKTHNKQNLVDVLTVFNDIFSVASEKAKVNIDNPSGITSSRDLLFCNYCNAGCNAVICSWILNGMKESPEEIADIISEASRKGPITILFPDK